jgi:hypothetical protein
MLWPYLLCKEEKREERRKGREKEKKKGIFSKPKILREKLNTIYVVGLKFIFVKENNRPN